MRSMWKGAISFGLVNIPVRMYAATQDKSISFNYLHAKCHTPIRYAKMCPTCNQEVTQEEIVRGYEFANGQYVVLTEEDFQSLPLPTSRAVEIVDFIDLNEIDPIYYEKSYYLEPGDGALKPYSLLRQAMLESGKVAVAQIAIRSRESMCCLRVYRNTLTLATMHYPDEVRPVTELAGTAEAPAVSPAELQMAIKLIEGLAAPFNPAKYQDNYREALYAIINTKAAGNLLHNVPNPSPAQTQVADLMAALEASLQALDAQSHGKSPAVPPIASTMPAQGAQAGSGSAAFPADAVTQTAKRPERKQETAMAGASVRRS